MKRIAYILLMMVALAFTGCAAMNTAIVNRNLDVQTKMSTTVFLDPVPLSERTVFVDIRNTSDKNIDVTQQVNSSIEQHGYKIIDDPSQAHFILQANILKIGKSTPQEAQSFLGTGYGGAIAGGTIGALAGASMGSSYNSGRTVAGGLIGAAVGMVADDLIKNVFYTMVTDVQIKEKPEAGEKITQQENNNSQNGVSGGISQNIVATNAQWKVYRTRIVSTANKVNLKFELARPELERGLAHSLGGLF